MVCVDVRREAADETVEIIRREDGAATAASCDATDSGAVAALVAEVMAAQGRIDVLHNNVGYAQMGGPVELSEADWHRALDLNLTTCFLTCKHVLPHMLAQRAGSIINISSAAAIRYTGYPYAAYYAAKAAVNNFTLGLALQYARDGIRANAIMPGLMNTPLIHQQISGSTRTRTRWCGPATPPARWAGWAPPGTSPTPPCSWPPTRPPTSPAWRSPSMAA